MELKDTNKIRFTLRLPAKMHKKLSAQASKLGISQNELITKILKEKA